MFTLPEYGDMRGTQYIIVYNFCSFGSCGRSPPDEDDSEDIMKSFGDPELADVDSYQLG